VFALGCVFISLNAAWRDRVIRPGPLAQQHAQLLERDGGTANCRACHAAASQSVAGWATSLVVSNSDQPTQSQLCMNCHAKTIASERALAAHNLPVRELEYIGRGAGDWGLGAEKQVACAACHREHHGAAFNLAAMDNAACQSCHQQKYESFASDHPDFGTWPYTRRTRIAFNHASHSGKHFAEKKQAFDCRVCHVTDSSGRVEQLASYDSACASCHDEKIATSLGRGVPMLSLPTLDMAAIKKAGFDTVPWPQRATGDFDGRLPPAMKLLLAADPAAKSAMESLGPGFEFQDVDSDDAVQVAACAVLAKSIRSLFADLGQRGPAAVRERLTPLAANEMREPDVAALVAGLSADTIRGTAAWLPGLDVGKDTWPLVGLNAKKSSDPFLSYDPAGVWSRDDATYLIRYLPAGHADPVLTAWLQLVAASPELQKQPVAAAVFKELSKPTAAGLCASCHSVEQGAGGAIVVNWKGLDRTAEPRGFTKFSHGPHLVLPQLSDCTSCHAIDEAASVAPYADLSPHHFVSEFKPMAKQACAACHRKTAAGDSCQSCHNYHVERVEGWRLATPGAGGDRTASGRLRISDFPPRRVNSLRIGEGGSESAIRNPQSEIR
jgi:hypothetical protein